MFVSVYALSEHLVNVFVSLVKSYQTLILTILSTLITVYSGWSFSIHVNISGICFEIS